MSKPRIIKDFVKLDPVIQEQIKLNYPDGFEQNLISFNDAKGNKVSALPFETEDVYYLVRMTVTQAQVLIEEVPIVPIESWWRSARRPSKIISPGAARLASMPCSRTR
ncbi:MAG: hypothetical protein RQ756_09010, partial [Flavobacteriaceae bacterium]|nr:hypothetical protein [Flavobacteriaceae bacterium]